MFFIFFSFLFCAFCIYFICIFCAIITFTICISAKKRLEHYRSNLSLYVSLFSLRLLIKKQYSFFTFPLLHSPLPVHPPPRHPERNSCQRHSCCHAHCKKDRIDSIFLEFRPVLHQHPVHCPVKCCSRNQRNCRGNQKYSYRRFMNSCHTFCIQSNSYC